MSKHWFIAHLIKKYTKGKNLGLDIGIGRGNWNEFKRCEMFGVDKNRNRFVDVEVDLEYPLPFRDNVFDIIISINVLNYVKNSHQIMREINRILKEEGIFLCVVDNPKSNNEPKDTWSQEYLNRILTVTGFSSILQKSLKDIFYAKWFNWKSVYAFAVAKKIKNIEKPRESNSKKIPNKKIEWAKSYNIKTTHPEN